MNSEAIEDDTAAQLDQAIARLAYKIDHRQTEAPRWLAEERLRLLRLIYLRAQTARARAAGAQRRAA